MVTDITLTACPSNIVTTVWNFSFDNKDISSDVNPVQCRECQNYTATDVIFTARSECGTAQLHSYALIFPSSTWTSLITHTSAWRVQIMQLHFFTACFGHSRSLPHLNTCTQLLNFLWQQKPTCKCDINHVWKSENYTTTLITLNIQHILVTFKHLYMNPEFTLIRRISL